MSLVHVCMRAMCHRQGEESQLSFATFTSLLRERQKKRLINMKHLHGGVFPLFLTFAFLIFSLYFAEWGWRYKALPLLWWPLYRGLRIRFFQDIGKWLASALSCSFLLSAAVFFFFLFQYFGPPSFLPPHHLCGGWPESWIKRKFSLSFRLCS